MGNMIKITIRRIVNLPSIKPFYDGISDLPKEGPIFSEISGFGFHLT